MAIESEAPLADDGESPSPGELGRQLVQSMATLTLNRIGDVGLENAKANLAYRQQGDSLRALREERVGEGETAVVVAAGPSIHRRDPAGQLKAVDYRGAVIATDSAMRYCLKAGIIPDLVVTLDPHAKRIVRWFGDPHLTQQDLRQDDYFARQDMDRAFADELRANDEMLELLERHGRHMRLALSTSASKAVVARAVETGMRIYWWNPMYDDPDLPDSKTRQLQRMNGLPCVNAGGNVGSACWMMAHAVLGKSRIALTGMDFSYYDGTPYSSTQYYHEAVSLVGERRLESIYIRVFNPHLGQWFFTDPAYMWYRECFLEMAAESDCETYNCTEGGILFGDAIRFANLQEFLGNTE